MPPVPDIAGFFDAQARLRQQTGVDATFIIPTDPVWPPGTALNPETGKPFDPTVVATSAGVPVEVVVRCSILTRLVGAIGNPTEDRAGGSFSGGSIALGVPEERRDEIDGATDVTVADVRYRVKDIKPDPAFNDVRRFIVFAENR